MYEIVFLEYIEYKSIIAEYKLRCVYMIRVRQNSKNVVVREYTKYKYEILFLEYIEYKSIIAKYKLRCVYIDKSKAKFEEFYERSRIEIYKQSRNEQRWKYDEINLVDTWPSNDTNVYIDFSLINLFSSNIIKFLRCNE